VNVEALLAAFARDGRPLSRELLEQIVAESDKQRYELSLDGLRIRARQGHSVEVITCEPPARPAMAHRTVKNSLARVTQVSTAADE
jgi:putative RNA 2'-phosphotransferase